MYLLLNCIEVCSTRRQKKRSFQANFDPKYAIHCLKKVRIKNFKTVVNKTINKNTPRK